MMKSVHYKQMKHTSTIRGCFAAVAQAANIQIPVYQFPLIILYFIKIIKTLTKHPQVNSLGEMEQEKYSSALLQSISNQLP